jgi:hypothetical protein
MRNAGADGPHERGAAIFKWIRLPTALALPVRCKDFGTSCGQLFNEPT